MYNPRQPDTDQLGVAWQPTTTGVLVRKADNYITTHRGSIITSARRGKDDGRPQAFEPNNPQGYKPTIVYRGDQQVGEARITGQTEQLRQLMATYPEASTADIYHMLATMPPCYDHSTQKAARMTQSPAPGFNQPAFSNPAGQWQQPHYPTQPPAQNWQQPYYPESSPATNWQQPHFTPFVSQSSVPSQATWPQSTTAVQQPWELTQQLPMDSAPSPEIGTDYGPNFFSDQPKTTMAAPQPASVQVSFVFPMGVMAASYADVVIQDSVIVLVTDRGQAGTMQGFQPAAMPDPFSLRTQGTEYRVLSLGLQFQHRQFDYTILCREK